MPPKNDRPLKFRNKSSKPMLFPLHPSNMADNRAYTKKRKRNFNPRPLIFLLAVVAIVCLIGYAASQQRALAVLVNDEVVGYIKDKNTTEEELNNLVLAKLKQEVGNNVEINDTITLEPVSSFFKKTDNSEQVVAAVCSTVSYNQEATTILVEGKEFCIVPDVETAREALETVLANYKCPEGTAQPEFAIQINTGTTFVDNSQVSSLEEAVKLLSATQTVEKTHTVVAGETFGSIASNAGMTEAELLNANPSITDETKTNLQIGQTLNVTVTEPILPIRTYSWETVTETIDYETVTQRNSNEPTSYREVIQEGEEGTMEVVLKTPYVNGEQIGEVQRTEKVVKEPVNRIIERGTYEPSEDSDEEDSSDSSSEE